MRFEKSVFYAETRRSLAAEFSWRNRYLANVILASQFGRRLFSLGLLPSILLGWGKSNGKNRWN